MPKQPEARKTDQPLALSSSAVLGPALPERADAGDEWAWEECEDWPEDDEPRRAPEFGCCLPPGECCMPGLHFPSECHTAADYQRRGRL